MLRVTAKAKEKLEESLQESTKDPEIAMRVLASPSKPGKYGFTWDKEREGDQVVESEGGRKVLFIQADLATKLEGIVFDHQETSQGTGFTLSKLGPSNKE